MKLKNIFILIFSFTFLFILFFNINNVFAITLNDLSFPDSLRSACGSDDIYNNLVNLPEFNNDYYYFFRNNRGVSIDVNFIKKSAFPDFKLYIEVSTSSSNPARYCTLRSGLGNISATNPGDIVIYVYDNSISNFVKHSSTSFNYSYLDGENNIITSYTNATIYTDNTFSDVFFQVPVQEVVIPALETAQEVPMAMIQTLKILIPVGLVLFGIGLSVYLIRRILS